MTPPNAWYRIPNILIEPRVSDKDLGTLDSQEIGDKPVLKMPF
jgi:hypothetical protein